MIWQLVTRSLLFMSIASLSMGRVISSYEEKAYNMKINENTKIIGKNVVLIPYMKSHVRKYHEWMKSEELRQLTASEPLSLEEEYEMQKSWRNDDDKCTFIVVEKSVLQENDEIEAMIGDTNIFLPDLNNKSLGEAEIMIAEMSARGKKRGWEAMLLMLYYGIEKLGIQEYQAKISMENRASLSMFEKLKFKEVSKSEIFKEITLYKKVDDDWKLWILNNLDELNYTSYV